MFRQGFVAASALLVSCGAALLPLAAFVGAQEPENPTFHMDIVVVTNLATGKKHAEAYLEALTSEAENAYSGLQVKTYKPEEKPKDGIGKHRLFIEHKGAVAIGSALTAKSGFPKANFKTYEDGKAIDIVVGKELKHHQTIWYLPASQKGTLAFKFQQWEESAYKTLDSWSIPVPDRDEMGSGKGFFRVADWVQDVTKGKLDLKPKCPKSLEQAKEEALMATMPGEFARSIHVRLAKGTVVKAKADGAGMIDFELMVENKAPWPLGKVKADAFAQGLVLVRDVSFKPPIPPGTTGSAKTSVKPGPPDPKRIPGVRLSELNFFR